MAGRSRAQQRHPAGDRTARPAAALSTVVVLLLYRFVPARRLRFADALAGAIFTALLLLAISLGSGWLYGRTSNLSVVYGSLTAASSLFLYSSTSMHRPFCSAPRWRRRGRIPARRRTSRSAPRSAGSCSASSSARIHRRLASSSHPAEGHPARGRLHHRRSLRRPRSPPTTTLGLRTTRAGNPVAEPAARAPPAGRREARSRR